MSDPWTPPQKANWNTTDNQKPDSEQGEPKELVKSQEAEFVGFPKMSQTDQAYVNQQNRENKRALKIECLRQAHSNGNTIDPHGNKVYDHAKVLEAAKAYYEFVRK